MELIVTRDGTLRYLYQEDLNLEALGPPAIRRASQVEPDQEGRWFADLAPVAGPLLGPFRLRSEAVKAESEWLETNRLGQGAGP